MWVGFSCPDFLSYLYIWIWPIDPTFSQNSKGKDIYSKEMYLFFKGENKISLINYPRELSVYASRLERLLRMINSFPDLFLWDSEQLYVRWSWISVCSSVITPLKRFFLCDVVLFYNKVIFPSTWMEKSGWSHPILLFSSGKEWNLPALCLCICGPMSSSSVLAAGMIGCSKAFCALPNCCHFPEIKKSLGFFLFAVTMPGKLFERPLGNWMLAAGVTSLFQNSSLKIPVTSC